MRWAVVLHDSGATVPWVANFGTTNEVMRGPSPTDDASVRATCWAGESELARRVNCSG
jgi:hypothetical protein